MRIGVLSTTYPRDASDAAGRFVKDLADALAERGHDLEVLFAEDRTIAHPTLDGAVRLSPLRYAWPRALERSFYGGGVFENLSRDPLALFGLASFPWSLAHAARRKSAQMDALISHFLVPSGWIAAGIALPQIAIAHSADLYLLERLPGRRQIARRIDKRARLLFVSEQARARFERVLGRGLRMAPIISPMGVREVPYVERQEARRLLSLADDDLVLVSLGRLVPIKGHASVIDAIAGLDDVRYVIGGAGPESENLEVRARATGVDLRLLGALDSVGKAQLFAAADVFVHPSLVLEGGRTEGVPVALMEALAEGLPTIATRAGGIASYFKADSEQLRLVPPGDVAALREAIVAWLRGRRVSLSRFRPSVHPVPRAEDLALQLEEALSALVSIGRT